jgi:hypothetical protein
MGLSIAKLIGLTALLLAAASLGTASSDNSSAGENESSNATAAALPVMEAPPSIPEPSVSEPADVKGLWNVSLAGIHITMALNQSEDSLFGRAKFEGDHPWNGVAAGSISGKHVYIALAAMQGSPLLVSTELIGEADGDIIQGSYVRSDSEGRAAKGNMRAERFNLETGGYAPAVEEEAPQPAPEEAPQAAKEEPAVQSISSRGAFKDVRELAKGINPNIMPSSVPL